MYARFALQWVTTHTVVNSALGTHPTPPPSVQRVTGLGAGQPRNRGSIAGKGKRFLPSPKCPDRVWSTPASYTMGNQAFPRRQGGRVMLTTYPHLVPGLRKMAWTVKTLPCLSK